jgi:hypothetical protein
LTKALCTTAIILFVGPALIALRAQQVAPAPAPDRNYKLIRSDEDWSFLRDENLQSDFWDPIKYIPLRKADKNWFVTFGGEARETWEQIGNDNWGQSPIMNGYLNERYMLYADLHYGPHVRTFLELKSGINSWRAGGPRPIDEKRLDFQSAFLEVGGETSWGSVHVRACR